MTRLLWMPQRCEAAGLKVECVDGWQHRGSSTFEPKGGVCHHTAGAAKGNMPSLGVLVYGRADLAGPLCQVGLARDGTVYVIASGRANHAGAGGWKGLSGNRSVWGIEAESVGNGMDWTAEQRRVFPILARVLADGCGHGVDMICAHREWTTRKLDPAGIDMNQLRAAAAAWSIEEDDMSTPDYRRGLVRQLYLQLFGRHPESTQAQEDWAQRIVDVGYDAVVRELADSEEAVLRRGA